MRGIDCLFFLGYRFYVCKNGKIRLWVRELWGILSYVVGCKRIFVVVFDVGRFWILVIGVWIRGYWLFFVV